MKYVEERHEFGSDRPQPSPGVMQVIYREGIPYAVDFLCPCGCGSGCFTPVKPSSHTHAWDYSPGPTLSPSIRYLSGCKAHFNITNGEALVHGDSGQ